MLLAAYTASLCLTFHKPKEIRRKVILIKLRFCFYFYSKLNKQTTHIQTKHKKNSNKLKQLMPTDFKVYDILGKAKVSKS